MLDSTKATDTSNSLVVITATSDVAITGNQETMLNGTATFASLMFTVCPPSGKTTLTLTAGGQGSLPVSGKKVVTGEINITGNPNSGMVFGTVGSYFLKEGDRVTVTKDISIPPVLVELFDGCNVRDMGSSAIIITVNADAGSHTHPNRCQGRYHLFGFEVWCAVCD